MAFSLPLAAIRVPGSILLERQLNYRPLALVDVVEAFAYYVTAILLVLAGWGVWGMATASVVRAAVGSGVLLALFSPGRMLPLISWARVEHLLGFGFRYQAVGVVNLLRDQGMNAAIAIFAGISALGLWSVAYRVLQIYLVFLNALRRVSFPAMSRLVAAGENLGPTIERVVAVVAVVSGLILAPLVAATPAWVPALLGSQWTDVVPVLPPACLQLMVMGPISVALIGYLWALGEASAVLRATLVGIPCMAVVLIPLLILIGAPAVGFGWMAAGAAEAIVMLITARRHAEFKLAGRIVPPTLFAVAGALAGWIVAIQVGATVIGGLAGGLCAAAVYLSASWLWHRRYLLDSAQLSLRGLREATRSTPAN
jgi:O-antigen/teichoic acid export membrane protein